jgi:glycogen debranching enzyme
MSDSSNPVTLARRRPEGPSSTAAPPKESPFYIQAASSPADQTTFVLKHGETFAVFDRYGDIDPEGLGEKGIYHEGTRYLSFLLLTLGDVRPLYLSSNVKDENDLLTIDLTNPDLYSQDRLMVPRSKLHIFRSKFIWQAAAYERIRIHNHSLAAIKETLKIQFDADCADIFEVRGTRRKRWGRYLDPEIASDSVVLAYEGLDAITRRTRILFSPEPDQIDAGQAIFNLALPPGAEQTILMIASFENGPQRAASPLSYDQAMNTEARTVHSLRKEIAEVWTSSEQFNRWFNRATADLHMMTTQTPEGPFPYAGVPWYSTPFGRDGIITALECLWFHPGLAKGVLRFLASTQATEIRPEADAEPGKILHEARGGEMANLGEIPFKRYYGSVDATPLFIFLAGEYFKRTNDLNLIENLWPHIESALEWIDHFGDSNGDGFVDYNRKSSSGLVQQGWKDSHDAIFHEDGSPAAGPIALCEVQGYVFAAKQAAASLASSLGKFDLSKRLLEEAEKLRQFFEEQFWCETISTYALALDGKKKPCRVRTSNAGHCLLTGIAGTDRGRKVAQTLLSEESFSGWGIRTVAASEIGYNPMSYHDGSVWPHDNALITQGLARYGLKSATLKVFEAFFDASVNLDFHRLPELFCGFQRRPGEGPTRYPVACAPQSWSAASVFLFLQASLGLTINGKEGLVTFKNPVLPEFITEIRIRNLQSGRGSVDLLLQNHEHDVGINVLRKTGDAQVLVVI